jgi:hypothetical protein
LGDVVDELEVVGEVEIVEEIDFEKGFEKKSFKLSTLNQKPSR